MSNDIYDFYRINTLVMSATMSMDRIVDNNCYLAGLLESHSYSNVIDSI